MWRTFWLLLPKVCTFSLFGFPWLLFPSVIAVIWLEQPGFLFYPDTRIHTLCVSHLTHPNISCHRSSTLPFRLSLLVLKIAYLVLIRRGVPAVECVAFPCSSTFALQSLLKSYLRVASPDQNWFHCFFPFSSPPVAFFKSSNLIWLSQLPAFCLYCNAMYFCPPHFHPWFYHPHFSSYSPSYGFLHCCAFFILTNSWSS